MTGDEKWILLGEPTQVVKEFTEILTREEKKVFTPPLAKGGKGPDT